MMSQLEAYFSQLDAIYTDSSQPAVADVAIVFCKATSCIVAGRITFAEIPPCEPEIEMMDTTWVYSARIALTRPQLLNALKANQFSTDIFPKLPSTIQPNCAWNDPVLSGEERDGIVGDKARRPLFGVFGSIERPNASQNDVALREDLRHSKYLSWETLNEELRLDQYTPLVANGSLRLQSELEIVVSETAVVNGYVTLDVVVFKALDFERVTARCQFDKGVAKEMERIESSSSDARKLLRFRYPMAPAEKIPAVRFWVRYSQRNVLEAPLDRGNGNISADEWTVISKLMVPLPGYVLKFNDETFSEFFETNGINIAFYMPAGTSKAKALRSFLEKGSISSVIKILKALRQRLPIDALDPFSIAKFDEIVSRLDSVNSLMGSFGNVFDGNQLVGARGEISSQDIVVDAISPVIGPEEDAELVLLTLAEYGEGDQRGHASLDGADLGRRTKLSIPRLNDAIEFLEEKTLVEVHAYLGVETPETELTGKGRLEARKIVAARNAKTSTRSAKEIRHELLAKLYELTGLSVGIWDGDPEDLDRMARAKEARYLIEKGLVMGSVGAHGGLSLRLTAAGRDFFESGSASSFTNREAQPNVIQRIVTQPPGPGIHQHIGIGPSSMPQPSMSSGVHSQRLIDDKWLLGKQIGRGGFGQVYEAVNNITKRNVVVKLIAVNGETGGMRFKREAACLGLLDHPAIPDVLDAGHQYGEELAFIVQEKLIGADLSALLDAHWRPNESEIVEILRQIAVALEFAHSKGIIHRDLKPANLFLDCKSIVRCIRVLDFGCAKLLDSEKLSQTGNPPGTFGYQSPESFSGAPTKTSTDIWSLGIVIYQLATGRLPFEASAPAALMAKIVGGVYERLSNVDFPILAPIVTACLHPDPKERLQEGKQVIDMLDFAMQTHTKNPDRS